MSTLSTFDQTRYFLGHLCSKNHCFENTNHSLRYLRNKRCVACNSEGKRPCFSEARAEKRRQKESQIRTILQSSLGQGEWQPVIGYEGWYEVSSLGHVKRVKGDDNTFAGKILKEHVSKRGYARVSLSKNNRVHVQKIHIIVAEAFHGPRPLGYVINHLDGNKLNNAAKNLRYDTPRENSLHALAMGLCDMNRGERHYKAKLTEVDVKKIRELANNLSQREIAKMFGVSHPSIGNIVMRKNWKHI